MSDFNENNDFSKSFDCLSIKTNQTNQLKSNSKPKRKNSEKRKEKSRKAARERRSQESKIFDQMEALLPIPAKNINHLDKASLVRLAINYLKIRKVIEPIKDVSNFKDEIGLLSDDFSAAKALNGFMLVLSREGDMVYMSEDVDKYLGLTQIDLIGQSIYDFSHPCDHNDIKDVLTLKHVTADGEREDSIPASFFVRMKCTITNKGRNLNLKSANYKVIHCTGHLKRIVEYDSSGEESAEPVGHNNCRYFMTSVCEPIDHPLTIDRNIGSNVFMSRHSLDMKFTSVDDSVHQLLGYKANELSGKSMFNFFHALDLHQLEKFFKSLFAKGQSESQCYRFLAKTGGYLWLLTQATVITDNHSSQPQSVVCVNHVISGVVNKSEILSDEQCFEEPLLAPKAPLLESVKTATEEVIVRLEPSFQSSTKTVFAPKTADMDTDFIVYADNGLPLTTDVDDLTHLAPWAGDDDCVPKPGLLAEFNDVNFFEEVFLNNNNLFTDDEKLKLSDDSSLHFIGPNDGMNGSPIDELNDKLNDNTIYKSFPQNLIKTYNNFRDNSNSNVDDSPLPNDPFLSPNDDKFSNSPSTDSSVDPYSSETNSPLNIPSPILSQTSNFFLCKSPTEEVSKLNLNDNKVDFIDDKTLEMRAPFIPIDEDFPLLLDGDLQMNYTNANIDDLNFGNISDDKLLSPTTVDPLTKTSMTLFDGQTPQKANCLEVLLQTDLSQKTHSKDKQNLNFYNSLKSDTKSSDKSATNSLQTKLQIVYNNINQSFGALKGNSLSLNERQVFPLNEPKGVQKTCFDLNQMRANAVNNGFASVKASNASKRPHSSDTLSDIRYQFYTRSPAEVLPKDSSTKRFKMNTNAIRRDKMEATKGNSVLLNLLVNGEDVSNGYKKYSNLDSSHRSSNSSHTSANLSQKRSSPTVLFEGQDIR